MKAHKFALIGIAGYVAPRHLKAIKDTRQELVAALDKTDNVGIIDSFFPNAAFFLESERFDRHIYKLNKKGEDEKVDFFSICSPNYLHDAHIRLALRNQANAICEKPIVLNPWNLKSLEEIEKDTGQRIFHILQLRLHPSVVALKKKIEQEKENRIFDIDLTYITGRGRWYDYSWKGDIEKSGGITTNIGSHFFDMLTYIFGEVKEIYVHLSTPRKAAGYLVLEKARVRWFLSIDIEDLPDAIRLTGKTTYRSLLIDNEEFEFSDGFNDLHTLSYQKILDGEGFTLKDAQAYVYLCHKIRTANTLPTKGELHPFLIKNRF